MAIRDLSVELPYTEDSWVDLTPNPTLGQALFELTRPRDHDRMRSTFGNAIGQPSLANLTEAHRRPESGHTIGKLVLSAMAWLVLKTRRLQDA